VTTYKVIFNFSGRVKEVEELVLGDHIIQHGEFQIPIHVGSADEVTIRLHASRGDLFDLDIPSLRLGENAENATAKRIDTRVIPEVTLWPGQGDTVLSIIGSRKDESYLTVKRLDTPPVKGERALDR